MGPWQLYKLRLFNSFPKSLRTFAYYFQHPTSIKSYNMDCPCQVVYKPRVLLVNSEAFVPITATFDTCSRLHVSTASAYNWLSYFTFNVMVLKCMHCITRSMLNVSLTGCVDVCFANWVCQCVPVGI